MKIKRGSFLLLAAWRCKDGRVLLIQDMETSHLTNTVAMLRRKGYVSEQEAVDAPRPMSFGGEYAQMFADAQFDVEMNDWLRQKIHLGLGHLERELAQRAVAHVH